jgi:hypothetical protein
LRVASRDSRTYRTRVAALGVGLVIVGFFTFFTRGDDLSPAEFGRWIFAPLGTLAFYMALLAGVAATSDSISREKREGTLGLLFLTDLKGMDVVLGKLFSRGLNGFYALLAFMPLLGIPLLFGGIRGSDFFQVALLILNSFFFSLSAGLFVSSISSNERRALFGAVFLVALISLLPLGLGFVLVNYQDSLGFLHQEVIERTYLLSCSFSPLFTLVNGLFRMFNPIPPGAPAPPELLAVLASLQSAQNYWIALGGIHLLSWLLLILAAAVLPAARRQETGNLWKGGWIERFSAGAGKRNHRDGLLEVNPFLWLMLRGRWKQSQPWIFVGAVILIGLWSYLTYSSVIFDPYPLFPMVQLVLLVFKIWLTGEVCQRISIDQRSGALELMLTTPLGVEEILRGVWLGMKSLFLWPLVAFCLFLVVALAGRYPVIALILPVQFMLFLDLFTLIWVGTYLGLKNSRVNQAIWSALGLVLGVPWIASMLIFGSGDYLRGRFLGLPEFTFEQRFAIWFVGGVIWNLLLLFAWILPRLETRFRVLAAEKYVSSANFAAGKNAEG